MTDAGIILNIVAGLILLFAGAEGLIRGSTSLALKMGISPLVVGLTVVAFGTSSPELVVSVKAALEYNSGISIGNVVGSNICNIALIIGISALIRPMKIEAQVVKKEIPIMLLATAIFLIFVIGGISRTEGIILAAGIIAYVAYGIISSKKMNIDAEPAIEGEYKPPKKTLLAVFFAAAGLGLLAFGSNIFVNGAVAAAQKMGISQVVIGLTIVSIGTSLPELFTSVVAALRGKSDIAIGNIIGSNIFNVMAIIGISASITPIAEPGLTLIDVSILIIVSLIIWPLSFSHFTLKRWEGGLLFAGYLGYMIYLIF
jgi:cation:H+ antiporter